MKIDWARKLTSRKFLAAVGLFVAGILTMIIGNKETVYAVVGAGMSIIATVAYCIIEGVLDRASLCEIKNASKDIAEAFDAPQAAVDGIENAAEVIDVLISSDEEGGTAS